MSETQQWFNLHIYYYDEQKDQLILDCVQPLFQKIKGHVERAFFVRHWTHGPHLRLRFLCTSEQFATLVQPMVETKVGSYLKAHPSSTILNEEQLRPLYEHLARQEQEREAVLPLFPNNSIQYLPYDRRLHVLKNLLLAELLEDFYSASNELVFEMLTFVRQGYNLLTLCLDLMHTTAYMLSSHITNGFLSYRSHAEGFIISCKQPQAMRALFEQKYQVQAGALTERLRRLLQSLQQQEALFPFTRPWSLLLQNFWERAETLIQTNQIDAMPPLEGDIPGFTGTAREHLSQSAFHWQLEGQPEYKKALYEDKWFQTYRLMLNLLYLHLNRLGVRPIERFMLCHLAANSVEEVFHVKAEEIMADPASAIRAMRTAQDTPAVQKEGRAAWQSS